MLRLLKVVGVLTLATMIYIILANVLVYFSYQSMIYDSNDEIDRKYDVGLILGTSKWTKHGDQNEFFYGRVEASALLYKSQVVDHLILSGDNSQMEYNEPIELRKALLERDVDDRDMTLDYAGFRTLDSVVRSKEVFEQDSVLVITQSFHLPRALFIAHKNGIYAEGYVAEGPSLPLSVWFRELLARPMAVADVYLFRRRPKFLGEKEEIIIRRR